MQKLIEKTMMKNEQTLLTCPYITIAGSIIQIENYKKVYKYTSEEIVILFNLQSNDIQIIGDKLKIILITKYVISIQGNIKKINYINKT